MGVYTPPYENGVSGEYTLFIGEEVLSIDNIPDKMVALQIPKQKYIKFTTKTGAMPNVIVNAWKEIWKMNEANLGGYRMFIADFEYYDQRASDSSNAEVDIYIGIKGRVNGTPSKEKINLNFLTSDNYSNTLASIN